MAEIFILLARMTDDPVLAPVLLGAADDVHHLVLVAGPAAIRAVQQYANCDEAVT